MNTFLRKNIAEHRQHHIDAFLKDYEKGRSENRYQYQNLPSLDSLIFILI